MKRLIINADDFGWDVETTSTTISLIQRGIVTSASIMLGRPATEMALKYARSRAGDKISFGLHLNIVDGMLPVSHQPHSLVNRTGSFRRSHYQRIAALFGRLRASDLEQEIRAQLDLLLESGICPTHVDSHGHLHKIPQIARVLSEVLKEYDINYVRRSQNIYHGHSLSDFLDTYSAWRSPKFLSTDYFYAPNGRGDWLQQFIGDLPVGTTELGVHPGNAEEWRRVETVPLSQIDPDSFARQGIELISYRYRLATMGL